MRTPPVRFRLVMLLALLPTLAATACDGGVDAGSIASNSATNATPSGAGGTSGEGRPASARDGGASGDGLSAGQPGAVPANERDAGTTGTPTPAGGNSNDASSRPETSLPPAPRAPRVLVFQNRCSSPVWVGALNAPNYELPGNGGWKLEPGASRSIGLPEKWGGRFWGRSECTFDASGKGVCATGDCGGKEQCGGAGGKTPASLAEFFFGGYGGKDFYDVSLVDGYNLPIGIAPKAGTFQKSDPKSAYECGAPACVSDLNATCPAELQRIDGAGKVVGCLSACEKFNTDEYCCRGAYGTPDKCPPTAYSKTFKLACPTAYSYAYDDKSSTYTCSATDYEVTFCP